MSLLPYNATSFELAIEEAIRYRIDTGLLNSFKFKTVGDNINMALSWEYSLSQINISNFRDRVVQGLQFHRLQGTPYSLRMVLRWYGFESIVIEEEVPGEHFSEFQIGLEDIPNNLDIKKIIGACELAAPLRSRLSRMYNNLYDVRRFVLDESSWGDFLSDHSGVQIYENSPKFSFGRINNFEATVDLPRLKSFIERIHYSFAVNNDTYRLDWTILDESDVGTLNHDMVRHVYRYMYNTNFPCDGMGDVFRTRKVAKALPVLSEDAILDDINTCFSGGYTVTDVEKFELSHSYLSEQPVSTSQVLISVRNFRTFSAYAENEFEHTAVRGNKNNYTAFTCISGSSTQADSIQHIFAASRYAGNNVWHDQEHFDVTWNDQKNYLGSIT